MRISRRDAQAGAPASRERWMVVALMALAFALGFLLAGSDAQRDALSLVRTLVSRPRFVLRAWMHPRLPSLALALDFDDYRRLGAQRAAAEPVPALLTAEDGSAAVSLRWAADPLAPALVSDGARWPLELATTEGGALGLRWATLTPADADALLAWAYLEALRQENFPTPRFALVRLNVNGSPWGLYALESVLPAPAQLPEDGVLLSLLPGDEPVDPAAPWLAYARARVRAVPLVDAGPVGDADWTGAAGLADTVRGVDEALATFRALESGELPPSAAFDAEALGRFLALARLWRGAPSLDWRTLRWLYEPAGGTFAPIGVAAPPDPATALPPAFTGDPAVHRAYVAALAALSDPAYLERWRAASGAAWDELALAAAPELGYVPAPWDALHERQAELRAALAPARPLRATVTEVEGALRLRLENVTPLPLEVLALELGERGTLPLLPAWIEPGDRATALDGPDAVILPARLAARPEPVHLRVPLDALPASLPGTAGEIRVIARVWGAEAEALVAAREE